MKRTDLIRHLLLQGCRFKQEGGRHTLFENPKTGLFSTVPRHTVVDTYLAEKICKDLGIIKPKKK
ncbi:MAG TPA: type II toxin-antitoxin system HicA family toxin [Patescibacteria group bacterium]|nr:type II toxin-antitoxin system HicA family toxin [Patescibacteria group bacterium]